MPGGRRRPKGRFGALRRFGGFRGGGAGDWAARVGLRGERGCAGEPVAREGRADRGVGRGGGGGPEGAVRREMCLGTGDRSRDFFVTVRGRMKFLINFSKVWKF